MVGAWPNYPVCRCKMLGGTIPSSDFAVLIDCLSVDVMWWSASDCCSDESRPESKIGRRMACRGRWWSYVVSLVCRSRVRTIYVPTLVSPSPFGTVGRLPSFAVLRQSLPSRWSLSLFSRGGPLWSQWCFCSNGGEVVVVAYWLRGEHGTVLWFCGIPHNWQYAFWLYYVALAGRGL